MPNTYPELLEDMTVGGPSFISCDMIRVERYEDGTCWAVAVPCKGSFHSGEAFFRERPFNKGRG